MQKVVTIAAYHGDLKYNNGRAFSDHTELNKLLEDGWGIQSHIVTTSPQGEQAMSITFILFKQ